MRCNPELTRRDAVKSMAAAVSGGAALSLMHSPALHGAEDEGAPTSIQSGLIDAHSHIWSRNVSRFPLAGKQTVDDLDPPSFTAAELLKTCEPHGVTRVVLIQHHLYHGWDNSYLTHTAMESPERFRVVGMVDDTSSNPAAQMRKLLDQHVTGFRITSWIRGKDKWLDGEGMASMWKCGADTGQAMCCLINPEDLEAVDHMCVKHPKTPVVIDHFGRVGVDGKIRETDIRQLCGLSKHANVHVKISAYYALGKKKPPYEDLIPMIRRVFDAFGPERLMWASDSPYQVVKGHTYQASIDLVRSGLDFLNATDRNWLLQKTAANVYHFDG